MCSGLGGIPTLSFGSLKQVCILSWFLPVAACSLQRKTKCFKLRLAGGTTFDGMAQSNVVQMSAKFFQTISVAYSLHHTDSVYLFDLCGWKSTEMQNLALEQSILMFSPWKVWQWGATLLDTSILQVLSKNLQTLLPCPGFTEVPMISTYYLLEPLQGQG